MHLRPDTMSHRRAAHSAAYQLSMEAQSRADGVLDRVAVAMQEANDRDWPEVRLALRHAEICHAQRWTSADLPALVADVEREALAADLPAARALTICHRALANFAAGDTRTFLDDMAEAAALLSVTGQYPINRLAGLISLGNTFDQVRLWELADRAYVDAQGLLHGLDEPDAPASVLAQNRAEVLLAQVLSLAEMGNVEMATARLDGGDDVLAAALTTASPASWHHRIEGLRLVAEVLCHRLPEPDISATTTLVTDLRAHGEREIGLLVELLLPSAMWSAPPNHDVPTGDVPRRARPDLSETHDGPHATLAWLLLARGLGAGGAAPAEVLAAHQRHAQLLATRAWHSRRAVVEGVAASIDSRLLEAERQVLASQVVTDALTGLGNRRAFEAAMDTRDGRTTTLMLIDLNDFKTVNDLFGHPVGDSVLKRCAALVHGVAVDAVLSARIGGDEFAVVIDGSCNDSARELAAALSAAMVHADWGGLTPGLTPSATVGVAVGPAGVDLIHAADQDMYDGKRRRSRKDRRRHR